MTYLYLVVKIWDKIHLLIRFLFLVNSNTIWITTFMVMCFYIIIIIIIMSRRWNGFPGPSFTIHLNSPSPPAVLPFIYNSSGRTQIFSHVGCLSLSGFDEIYEALFETGTSLTEKVELLKISSSWSPNTVKGSIGVHRL